MLINPLGRKSVFFIVLNIGHNLDRVGETELDLLIDAYSLFWFNLVLSACYPSGGIFSLFRTGIKNRF